MKKDYKKPIVIIENYTLCGNIAGSCDSMSPNIEGLIETYKQMNPYATEQDIIDYLNSLGMGEFCYHTSQGTNTFYS